MEPDCSVIGWNFIDSSKKKNSGNLSDYNSSSFVFSHNFKTGLFTATKHLSKILFKIILCKC